jgi:hypothetical protein
MKALLFIACVASPLALAAAACSSEQSISLLSKQSIHTAARMPNIEINQRFSEVIVEDRTMPEKSAYLDRLEKAIEDLGVPPEVAEGQIDADEARALADMDRKRDVLREDYRAAEQATSEEWPVLKARIDADLDAFKRAVRRASSRSAQGAPRGE